MDETMDVPGFFDEVTRRVRERPDEPALLVGDRGGALRPVTFAQVYGGCARTAAALRGAGVRPRQRAVVMARHPYHMVVTVYGLLAVGAVPVLIDPGLPRAALRRCLDEVAPEVFAGEPAAHVARRLLGWARGHVTVPLVTGRAIPGLGGGLPPVPGPAPEGPGEGPALDAPPVRLDDLAVIAFTSGSTGTPKGVEYRFETLAAQIRLATAAMGLEPGAVLATGFPPFALFGPVNGVTTVVPAIRYPWPARTPGARIVRPLLASGASAIGGGPAVLRVVADHCARHGLTLPAVRRVYSFGAPLPERLAEDFARVLPPDARVISVYGATECLPVSQVDAAEAKAARDEAAAAGAVGAAGTCVGRPVPGVEVRIVPAGDGSGDGEIAVAGPNVAPGYHGRPEATAAARVPHEGGVLHRTGDLGRLDDAGRLWFLGRAADRVTGEGFTLTTEDIEAAAGRVPGVARAALVGVGPRGRQRAVLCVELSGRRGRAERRATLRAVRAALAALPTGRHVGEILTHRRFPTDVRHNAKIDRDRLARWAARHRRREGAP
ncbi:AMP-binding protein [Streptomyces sp. 6N223]|uniref:AMP-binding protein n=1 Tax=Streptomyces sp. 6N223 TaxID=3457412 RepID=UPI003FD2B3D6